MSSVASSPVTLLRSRPDAGPVQVLADLLAEPATTAGAFDRVAAAHDEVWAAATILAALRRIAHDERDGTAEAQLATVADSDVDEHAVAVTLALGISVHARATTVAVSSAAGRDDDVLVLTHGIEVVDDLTALLLTYRASALAGVGMVASATEALDRVLGSPRRHPAVRAFARRERNRVRSSARMP